MSYGNVTYTWMVFVPHSYERDVEYGILNMLLRDVECCTGMLHMGC